MTARQLAVVVALALTAGVTTVLALAAAADAHLNPGGAILTALTAVWVSTSGCASTTSPTWAWRAARTRGAPSSSCPPSAVGIGRD